MKAVFTAFTVCASLAFAGPGLTQDCRPMPGLASTVSLERVDYLLVGETHGTKELPTAFAEIVCAALEGGRPIVVGIEQPPSDQPALDAYMASDGGLPAREALIAAPAWAADTRFSVAMADLIETLRAWRAAGANLTLVAFDEPAGQPGTNAAREESMARQLEAARNARPGSLAVALTGLGHADKEGFVSMSPPVASMMMHLPPERSASLAFVRAGGESWRCRREEGATHDVCGAASLTAREPALPRGVHAAPGSAAFDGLYSPGVVLTASPPARAGGAAH
jgi:hypothetical protein